MTGFAEDYGSYKPESETKCAARQGWEDAALAAGSVAQDELLIDVMLSNRFDRTEWEW
jgi:hypothetical protein